MVTTRSGAGYSPPPDRTALQLQRDQIAAGMDMTSWMSPDRLSRGIRNGLNLCYQNAVFQALMHQPPFMNWILQHNPQHNPCKVSEAKPCLKCLLKGLTRVYWQSPSTTNPIAERGGLRDIARLSFELNQFKRNDQEDAFMFYNWILNELRAASSDPNLDLQLEPLYNLTLQYHDHCTACGTPHSSTTLTDETSMSIGVNRAHTSIQQAIAASLQHRIGGVHCEVCNSNQIKTRWTEIVAAPKILRIHLQIMLGEKIFHTLAHPDLLDLTAHQQNPTLPLQYQLGSVIAHYGNATGHYIASVREPKHGQFSSISDSSVTSISHREFLANLQWRKCEQFEVYVLAYIRDDTKRNMPTRIPTKWVKEMKQLKTGKGAYPSAEPPQAVVYPTVEPQSWKEPSRKRAAGQDRQQGTTQKRRKGS